MNEIWDLKSQRSINIRRFAEAAANFWALATRAWMLPCQPFYDHWTVSWVYMELNIPIIIGLRALDEQKDFTWTPHLPKSNGISCRVANALFFFMNSTTKTFTTRLDNHHRQSCYFIWNCEWILHGIQKFCYISRSNNSRSATLPSTRFFLFFSHWGSFWKAAQKWSCLDERAPCVLAFSRSALPLRASR